MPTRSVSAQVLGLLGWLLAAFLAGGVGAIASINAEAFYAELSKPSWAPPAGVFGPVWSVLYVLMGVAAWRVWRSPGPRQLALELFIVQLVANALWSWLFFGWQLGAVAAVEVLILLALVIATAVAFWRVDRLASLLMVPYILWVGFAAALNWAIWWGNPALL